MVIGIGGVRRNAACALARNGRVLAACEQERLTRIKGVGMPDGSLPQEALEAVLRIANTTASDVSAIAAAERGLTLPAPPVRLHHHRTHAASAFFSSPFEDATILVCDRRSTPELSVWRGTGSGLEPVEFPWEGPALASLYSDATRAFGWRDDGDEHRLESLARAASEKCAGRAAPLVRLSGQRLEVAADFVERLAGWAGVNGHRPAGVEGAGAAAALQCRLGEVLVDIVADVHRRAGGRQLCLAGGLFYNTYFTSIVEQSHVFDRVFVPVAPGNAGLAVGAALSVDGAGPVPPRTAAGLSPFLGPEYGPQEIKAVLDNCKVPYALLHDRQVIDETVGALARGHLVGWFQGRMEWGPRALGQRSILASPHSPYVLENLNRYLKGREAYQSYGVSVLEEDLDRYFEAPVPSPVMQYEFEVKAADVLRHVMPAGTRRLRVQTVGREPALFRTLLDSFGAATGMAMLVNTSFNGFHEPIVCSPRDAVRVFYGTGLDMVVIGSFILRK